MSSEEESRSAGADGSTTTLVAASCVSAECVALSFRSTASAASSATRSTQRGGSAAALPLCTRHVASAFFPPHVPSFDRGEALAGLTAPAGADAGASTAADAAASATAKCRSTRVLPERFAHRPNGAARYALGGSAGGVGAGVTSLSVSLAGVAVLGRPAADSGARQSRIASLTPWGNLYMAALPYGSEACALRPVDARLERALASAAEKLARSVLASASAPGTQARLERALSRAVVQELGVDLTRYDGLKEQVQAMVVQCVQRPGGDAAAAAAADAVPAPAGDGNAASGHMTARDDDGERLDTKRINLTALFSVPTPTRKCASASTMVDVSARRARVLAAANDCFDRDPQPRTISEFRSFAGLGDVGEMDIARALGYRGGRSSTTEYGFHRLGRALGSAATYTPGTDLVCFRKPRVAGDGTRAEHERAPKRRKGEGGAASSAAVAAVDRAPNPVVEKLREGWPAHNRARGGGDVNGIVLVTRAYL